MSEDFKDEDLDFARSNYYNLLMKGSEALEDMMEVARATEHPRAFEVLSGMMKNVADINTSLIDLHKKKSDMAKTQKGELPPAQTTNNLFVGSTAELQKMLINNDIKDVTPDDGEDS